MDRSDSREPAATSEASTLARNRMVDSQIRPNRVGDPRIIKAMRRLPRELFVSAGMQPLAYADRPVAVAPGRWLMEPRITGRLLQVSEPRAGERALVVAAAAGYTAILLSMLGLAVTALESEPELAARCEQLASRLAPGLRTVHGPLAAGCSEAAPFDLILIDGGVRRLPEELAAQLADGGRVATVLLPAGGVGTAVLAEPSTHGLRARAQFDASTPAIPDFTPPASFQF